ncbi:hypothetical protein IJT10_08145 [bacterium]|nr:hypothetical protein [bacterium]
MKEVWDILTLSFREWPTILKIKKLWIVELLYVLYYLVRLPSFDIWLQRRLIPDRAAEDFRYGETPYHTGLKLLQLAEVKEEDNFLDLGSGRGKMVFLAALATGCQARGVEMLPSYNILANRIKKNAHLDDRLQFLDDDFLECDLTGANVIFTACTSWSQLTRDLLLDRVDELSEGTRWISVGREQKHPNLKLWQSGKLLFSWGYENFWIYKVERKKENE